MPEQTWQCRNVQGLARLCPAEQEAGMWQGGSGQVIKELKCYLPAEPSCPFPAAWGQSCLGWRSRACPPLNLGKRMLKAAPCFLHPRAEDEGLARCSRSGGHGQGKVPNL